MLPVGRWALPNAWVPFGRKRSLPSSIIHNNETEEEKLKRLGVHFFLDDRHFEVVWRMRNRRLPYLKQYKVVLTPDFSPYPEWPRAMQLWNIYRSR